MTALEAQLVEALRRGPLTAIELREELGIAEGTLWNVLANLKRDGIVTIARVKLRGIGGGSGQGRAIYQLADPVPVDLQALAARVKGMR